MSKTNITPFKGLESALGVDPQPHYNVIPSNSQELSAEEQQYAKTADWIEDKIKDTIEQLDDAIDKVAVIGELSENQGAYRVLGELANSKIGALKELRELRKVAQKQVNVGTVNNTQVNAGVTGLSLNDVLKAMRDGIN
jgi:predicted transcriptional regulator